jgi:hypothetical protein
MWYGITNMVLIGACFIPMGLDNIGASLLLSLLLVAHNTTVWGGDISMVCSDPIAMIYQGLWW